MFGGQVGGGKSESLLLGATQYVDDYPTSALLLRRTYRELDKPGGLMFRAREWFQYTDAHWDGKNYRWIFPSGATINFGYLTHPGDEENFQSSEYDYIGFDELTHFTEHHYLYMFTRMRKLKDMPVPLRMRSGTNPGGPGHEWVRKRWDLPKGSKLPDDPVFIPSGLDDNPFLEKEDYKKGMDNLSGVVRAQLLDGDWTATSTGGYFDASQFRVIDWGDLPEAREFLAIIRYWDFAATEPSDEYPDPDYTVGLKLGLVMNRETKITDWYVLDVVRFQGNPGTVEATVRETGLRDGPRVVQWLEQERGAAGKLNFVNYAVNVLPNSTCRPLYATGKKEEKAKIPAARTKEGRVYLLMGDWIPDFRAECAIFPYGFHDDQVDALSNAIISTERERHYASAGIVENHSDKIQVVTRGKEPVGATHKGY